MTPDLIPVRKLASGEELSLSVFRFHGDPNAPSAYLQASLHGSEIQGNWVIAELLERLPRTEVLGNITLVPCANPFAQNHKIGEYTIGRFDPTDGENWNRAFQDFSSLADTLDLPWPEAKAELRGQILRLLKAKPAQSESYARKLARQLQTLAAEHDYLLDLHCASLCESYAYVPEYAFSSFPDLPVRHAVRFGPQCSGAMDECFVLPWWRLGQKIEARTGVFPALPEGYTLELGHQDWSDAELAARQAEGILYFLARRGVVRGEFRAMSFPSRFGCDLKDYATDFSEEAGFVSLKARLGEPLRKGAPHHEVLRFKDFGRRTFFSPQDRLPLVFTNASSVHEGVELGKSLTNYFQI